MWVLETLQPIRNPPAVQQRAKALPSQSPGRCPEVPMRNSDRQVHSYQLGSALHSMGTFPQRNSDTEDNSTSSEVSL